MADAWTFIDMPTGPQKLPAWVKGARINWMDGYGNPPGVTLKVWGDARTWDDKRFSFEGGRFYHARHEDGRMEQFSHGGPVSMAEVKRFVRPDGTVTGHRRSGVEWPDPTCPYPMMHEGELKPWGYEPGEWKLVQRLATTKQEGFCGDEFDITMIDGAEITLRGPWHTVGPDGYVEVAYVDAERFKPSSKWTWEKSGGVGGLYLTEDLFLRIMATFQPHIRFVRVKRFGWNDRIEPIKPEWDAPKAVILEREYQARSAALKGASA